jgi:hypothetical protein
VSRFERVGGRVRGRLSKWLFMGEVNVQTAGDTSLDRTSLNRQTKKIDSTIRKPSEDGSIRVETARNKIERQIRRCK